MAKATSIKALKRRAKKAKAPKKPFNSMAGLKTMLEGKGSFIEELTLEQQETIGNFAVTFAKNFWVNVGGYDPTHDMVKKVAHTAIHYSNINWRHTPAVAAFNTILLHDMPREVFSFNYMTTTPAEAREVLTAGGVEPSIQVSISVLIAMVHELNADATRLAGECVVF